MKHIYVLLAVGVSVSGWHLSELARNEWHTFKLEHKKQYDNATEELRRMKIYLAKRYMIAKHNKRFHRGLESFRINTNQFSDMTHQEYVEMTKGIKPKSRTTSKGPSTMFMSPANVVIPESVDWRKIGAVSKVQDQLECKACWAFSAAGALEGQLFRKNKILVPLSVQNMIDCSTQNYGCEGGYIGEAFDYIQNNKGIDIAKCYPYIAETETCRYDSKCSGGYNEGYVELPADDEEKLKEAVATIGPISAAIDASQETFSSYAYGVYYDDNCSSSYQDHAVLVVGYGTDKLGGDYWLLKNSFGTTWGEDGYMRLARNRQNHCGIASLNLYPLIPK